MNENTRGPAPTCCNYAKYCYVQDYTISHEPTCEKAATEPVTWDINEGAIPCGIYNWSITVGELKEAIKGIPDGYEVMLSNAEVDDIEISNVNINNLYPPYKGSPGILVLGGGQIVSKEYAFGERMDRSHDGTDVVEWWNNEKGWRVL